MLLKFFKWNDSYFDVVVDRNDDVWKFFYGWKCKFFF